MTLLWHANDFSLPSTAYMAKNNNKNKSNKERFSWMAATDTDTHTHTERSVVRMQYVSANKSNFGYSFDLLHDTHAHAHMHAMLYALTCS